MASLVGTVPLQTYNQLGHTGVTAGHAQAPPAASKTQSQSKIEASNNEDSATSAADSNSNCAARSIAQGPTNPKPPTVIITGFESVHDDLIDPNLCQLEGNALSSVDHQSNTTVTTDVQVEREPLVPVCKNLLNACNCH